MMTPGMWLPGIRQPSHQPSFVEGAARTARMLSRRTFTSLLSAQNRCAPRTSKIAIPSAIRTSTICGFPAVRIDESGCDSTVVAPGRGRRAILLPVAIPQRIRQQNRTDEDTRVCDVEYVEARRADADVDEIHHSAIRP